MSDYDSDILREIDCDDECCSVRWNAADVIDELQQRVEILEAKRKWLASPAEFKHLSNTCKNLRTSCKILAALVLKLEAELTKAQTKNIVKSGCNI